MKREYEDRVFTLLIGEKPILCFAAKNMPEGQTLLKEAWLQDDLQALRSHGARVWNGQTKLTVRYADIAEVGKYQREAAQSPKGELSLVYLIDLY